MTVGIDMRSRLLMRCFWFRDTREPVLERFILYIFIYIFLLVYFYCIWMILKLFLAYHDLHRRPNLILVTFSMATGSLWPFPLVLYLFYSSDWRRLCLICMVIDFELIIENNSFQKLNKSQHLIWKWNVTFHYFARTNFQPLRYIWKWTNRNRVLDFERNNLYENVWHEFHLSCVIRLISNVKRLEKLGFLCWLP